MSGPTQMVFDLSINLGNILVIVTMVGSVVIGIMKMKGASDLQAAVLSQQSSALSDRLEKVENSAIIISAELRKVGDILVTLGRYDIRFEMHEKRQERIEQLIDDLRRGKGLIE